MLSIEKEWLEEGKSEGFEVGGKDSFDFGLEKGLELGKEVGYYEGACDAVLSDIECISKSEKTKERIRNVAIQMKKIAGEIDWSDASKEELSDQIDSIRAKYMQLCSLCGWKKEEPQAGKTLDF